MKEDEIEDILDWDNEKDKGGRGEEWRKRRRSATAIDEKRMNEKIKREKKNERRSRAALYKKVNIFTCNLQMANGVG